MKIIGMKKLLADAYAGGYAVPAINVSNMETIRGVLQVAHELKSPMILQIAPIQIAQQNISYDYIVALIEKTVEEFDVVCSIHLDHGENKYDVIDCLNGGFTSVMFDGSSHSYEENIKLTSEIRELYKDTTLEGELGVLGGTEGTVNEDEDDSSIYTNPEKVEEYLEKTGVDCLAISIGNAHGFYKGEPKLNFEILEKINEKSTVPLVMHGASGLRRDDLRTAIKLGISKINFFTSVDYAFTQGIKKKLEESPNCYMMTYIEDARQNMMKEVREIIKTCGCEGKI